MSRRGFELAISTLILIVLGVVLLIGLIYFVTDGFKKFNRATDPLTDTNEVQSIRIACSMACEAEDWLTYCCKNFTAQDKIVFCHDSILNVGCGSAASCAVVSCPN